jgi:hypothetical protein
MSDAVKHKIASKSALNSYLASAMIQNTIFLDGNVIQYGTNGLTTEYFTDPKTGIISVLRPLLPIN